ncbi:hypothetical protein [Nannocystis bainbridge]|uniref:Uncharacterized protein n=1 Tax=Nannocystis bainbridge TaxID=2995303 RepID=A0ABT5DTB6_9BACT|nr:hypothetical protein [Nannocystis bainbridge]MDC0716865.1 hypothetical protein [Nannocystis bainbridge]
MSFKAGGHRLHTRGEWRFGARERGREALIAHVRRTARLGPLLPAGSAVALATTEAEADEVVLWHIVPDLPSLGAALTAATEAERPRQLARLAAAYAAALRLVAREGIVLTLDPHAFAEQDGRSVYLGDRLGEPERSPDLVGALLAPCAGLSEASRAAWQTALEQAVPATLTREDVAALGLERALTASATVPARAAEARARDRLRMTLGLCT